MPEPATFTRALIRYAQENGRAALAAIATSQFTVLTDNGGKQLTGVAAGGKSFTYTVPQGLSVKELLEHAEDALREYDWMTDDQRNQLLSGRPIRTSRARFY